MTGIAPSADRHRRSKRAQIVDHLRTAIATGEYPPGSRLPSTQELAREWDTQVPSVHRAMVQLADEGWLERVPRIGTFVLQPPRALTTVGIYTPVDALDDRAARFTLMLGRQLETALAEHGLGSVQWLDTETDPEQSAAWNLVRQGALEREIDALIMPQTDLPHYEAARRLPVPVAMQSSGVLLPGGVQLAVGDFLKAGVAALARAGCRTAGLISVAERRNVTFTPSGTQPGPDRVEEFSAAVAAAGMRTREAWIRLPRTNARVPETAAEQFGYEAFSALCGQNERPDGVLVYTDVAARGVLLAAAHLQVDVPGDLKLALHRNAELGLLCHVPATFIDVRIAEVAEQLIDQVKALHAGRKAPARQVVFHTSKS